jgi:tetratricopeptide (TPR) repeat protein
MTGEIGKSAFIAAFFALHPLHVESVAWISERKDVLSAFFLMLTLCLYVYYTEKPDIKKYLFVLLFFVCALMSKSIVVTLPVIMILLDYWPLGRFKSQKNKTNLMLWQLKEKIPFFVLSLYFSVLTLGARYNTTAKDFPFSDRFANALVSFETYLEKTFWPRDLAVFYPFPNQIPIWHIFGASLLITVISIAVIIMVRRQPYLFAGWLWYAITIVPVIGIIQVGNQAMADRYTYLPLIGIAVMLAWGVSLLIKNENVSKIFLFPAAIAFLAILSVLTWQQCGYWKNSDTLFNHALLVTKNNYLAHNNLGLVLFAEGKTTEAIVHYNEAIRIMPDHVLIYNNRGAAYTKLGQYQLAIEDFSKAIRLEPDYADSYIKRGAVYLKQGHKESSCYDAQKACELGNCALLEVANNKRDCR